MTTRQFSNIAGAGIPWYKRSDYKRILEIMIDRENLPPTFDKWQSLAEKAEDMIRRQGNTPFRAHINPEDFLAWCAARALDVDSKARSLFAADPANWEIAYKH